MTRTAIIVGAGIGGLATARALTQAGWSVEVLEAASRPHELGAGLALSRNGLRALDALGLGDDVRETGVRSLPEGARTQYGSPMQGSAEFDSSEIVGIARPSLMRILTEGAEASITTGARVTEVVTRGSRSTLVVEVGGEQQERTADLIVGADGIDSVVRGHLWPKAKPDYSGASCWRALVQAQADTPSGPVQWFGRGAEFGIVPVDEGRAYWYGAFVARMGRTAKDERAAALARFDAWDPVVRNHIAATADGAVLRHDLWFLPTTLRTFVAPGAALVGDAAHAMLPTIGQGANTTLEDAVTLGAYVGAQPLEDALVDYDLARVPRTQRLQRLSHRMFRTGADVKHPVLVAARNGLFNLVPTVVSELAADLALDWQPPRVD